MKLIFVGMILFKDVFKTHLVFAAPKSESNGQHITHNGQTFKGTHTTQSIQDATFKFEGTTMMEPIEYELRNDNIIPDLSSLDEVPEHVLKVVYKEDAKVCLGNTLSAAAVQDIPEHISWYCENPKLKFHTIIFVDLDVPMDHNLGNREWQHWIIGNIPDNRLRAGQTLTEYIGPTSKNGNGTHRYVFQLFLQKQGKIHFEETHISMKPEAPERAKFSSKKFAKKYSLGRAYAVNYFLVTWPEDCESKEEERTSVSIPPLSTG